jgi:hypothetical protein
MATKKQQKDGDKKASLRMSSGTTPKPKRLSVGFSGGAKKDKSGFGGSIGGSATVNLGKGLSFTGSGGGGGYKPKGRSFKGGAGGSIQLNYNTTIGKSKSRKPKKPF